MNRYRIICTPQEAAYLPASIDILETYPAFVVAQASADVMAQVRLRFPTEKLPSAPATHTEANPAFAVPASAPRAPGQESEKVVRFVGPVRPEWQRMLENAGARVVRPLGGSALVVQTQDPTAFARIAQHDKVLQVDPFVPALRLSPEFFTGLANTPPTAEGLAAAREKTVTAEAAADTKPATIPGLLVADFFTETDCQRAAQQLDAQGVRVAGYAGATRLTLDVASSGDAAAALQTIAGQPGLSSLEEKAFNVAHNNVARTIIGQDVVTDNHGGLGLDGQGEIIAIADSGLDTGAAATLHLDFQGRVKSLTSLPLAPWLSSLVTNPGGDDGAADKFSGHGTHVAGSVLGNGKQAVVLGLEPVKGVAPAADLVFQAIEQTPKWTLAAQISFWQRGQRPPVSGLFGIPDDLTQLFQAAYDQGARIHSNSWGGGKPGEYDAQCADVDRFIWEHQDFLVLVAAGNDGVNTSAATRSVDPTSVTSPGTAKNCLTVGASENNRPGQFTDTYGQWWPGDFPHPPFHDDPMTDASGDVVAFSSRGPCLSGRRTPDVIAPGTFILSTRSSQIAGNNFAWGAYPPAKAFYMYMGGTSMATPLVAGAVALVRQHLRQQAGLATPSAALLKAALIHSAEYLAYRYPHASSTRWADNEQGWGRVNLRRCLAPQAPAQVVFLDETAGLRTGEAHTYEIEVADGSVPLRATLVYTDFPGPDLVNNLNLVLYDPDGQYHLGNDFAGSGQMDALNNVEGVVVEAPKTGRWRVRVVASEVQQGTPGFALVLSGGGVQRV